MSLPGKLPIIAIVGTTGVGKSQLAIDLALAVRNSLPPFSTTSATSQNAAQPRFPSSAEIISADSMQVYKGLPIATNKVTPEEAKGVPHHLIGFLNMEEEYSVKDFVDESQDLISKFHAQNTLPIIVGGTNYYVQSLLWEGTLASETSGPTTPDAVDPDDDVVGSIASSDFVSAAHDPRDADLVARVRTALLTQQPPDRTVVRSQPPNSAPKLASMMSTSRLLHDLLKQVDPRMAAVRHPNDERRVKRSLEIWLQTGRQHSAILAEQRSISSTCTTLRMVRMGLLDEIREVRAWSRTRYPRPAEPDYTRGVFQAIGYKEFSAYLDAVEMDRGCSPVGDGTREPSEEAHKLWQEGMETMMRATRQYARQQVTWIRNKLAWQLRRGGDSPEIEVEPNGDGEVKAAAYVLDASAFLYNKVLPPPASIHPDATNLLSPSTNSLPISDPAFATRECEVCKDNDGGPKVLVGKVAWEQHVRAKRHKERVRRAAIAAAGGWRVMGQSQGALGGGGGEHNGGDDGGETELNE
ncbi:hypothetical protein HDU93_000157 [Gonapodya sp. JEL0774]|nr:hypothetical protein HDU93_000157 [Gonapodya sp. JEL0774]